MADGLRRRKFSPSVSNNGTGPIFDKSSIPTRNIINTAPTKGILILERLELEDQCKIYYIYGIRKCF